MLWRFSANHTHLYPDALLRSLDASSEIRLSPGDEVLVEFSDGVLACGRLLEADKGVARLDMPTYRTQRGTDVASRVWRLVSTGKPDVMRVHKRAPIT